MSPIQHFCRFIPVKQSLAHVSNVKWISAIFFSHYSSPNWYFCSTMRLCYSEQQNLISRKVHSSNMNQHSKPKHILLYTTAQLWLPCHAWWQYLFLLWGRGQGFLEIAKLLHIGVKKVLLVTAHMWCVLCSTPPMVELGSVTSAMRNALFLPRFDCTSTSVWCKCHQSKSQPVLWDTY